MKMSRPFRRKPGGPALLRAAPLVRPFNLRCPPLVQTEGESQQGTAPHNSAVLFVVTLQIAALLSRPSDVWGEGGRAD